MAIVGGLPEVEVSGLPQFDGDYGFVLNDMAFGAPVDDESLLASGRSSSLLLSPDLAITALTCGSMDRFALGRFHRAVERSAADQSVLPAPRSC